MLSYFLQKLEYEIQNNSQVSPSLAQFQDKFTAIKKTAYASDNEKLKAYFDALGLEGKPLNEGELLQFIIRNDPVVAHSFMETIKFLAKDPLVVKMLEKMNIKQVMSDVIEYGDLRLLGDFLELEVVQEKISPSMIDKALQLNKRMFADQLANFAQVSGIRLKHLFVPDIFYKIIMDKSYNLTEFEHDPGKFIQAFPITSLTSPAVPIVANFLSIAIKYNELLKKDFSQLDYQDVITLEKTAQKLIQDIVNNEKILNLIANDFEFSTPDISLFLKMHPNGRIESPLTPQDVRYLAKHYGHILGISKQIVLKDVDDENSKHTIECEGWEHYPALRTLDNFLKEYIASGALEDKAEKTYFSQIEEAVSACTNLFNKPGFDTYNQDAKNKLFERYNEGKIAYIASGWTRPEGDLASHAVNISLYGPYLIYTNRGEGGKVQGTNIYPLKDTKKITPEFIARLFPIANRSPEDLEKVLSEVIDLDKPILSLPSKRQERGTCTFANSKASIEGLLLLCAHVGEKGPQLPEGFSNPSREQYKSFTHFIREQAIDELIANAKWAQTPQMKEFYVSVIKSYIAEHFGQSRDKEKSKEDVLRLAKVLQNIPQEMQEALALDTETQQSMNSALVNAIQENEMSLIQELLKTQLIKDTIDRGALKWALIRNQAETVDTLIKLPAIKQLFLGDQLSYLSFFLPEDTFPLLFKAMKKENSLAPVLLQIYETAKAENKEPLLNALEKAGIPENKRRSMIFAKEVNEAVIKDPESSTPKVTPIAPRRRSQT
jgi:hypothetical protein